MKFNSKSACENKRSQNPVYAKAGIKCMESYDSCKEKCNYFRDQSLRSGNKEKEKNAYLCKWDRIKGYAQCESYLNMTECEKNRTAGHRKIGATCTYDKNKCDLDCQDKFEKYSTKTKDDPAYLCKWSVKDGYAACQGYLNMEECQKHITPSHRKLGISCTNEKNKCWRECQEKFKKYSISQKEPKKLFVDRDIQLQSSSKLIDKREKSVQPPRPLIGVGPSPVVSVSKPVSNKLDFNIRYMCHPKKGCIEFKSLAECKRSPLYKSYERIADAYPSFKNLGEFCTYDKKGCDRYCKKNSEAINKVVNQIIAKEGNRMNFWVTKTGGECENLTPTEDEFNTKYKDMPKSKMFKNKSECERAALFGD